MHTFVNVDSSVLMTLLWTVCGLVTYYYFWVVFGTAKTPVLNPKTSIYKDPVNDHRHTNLFTYIYQV